jgi:hypothetical protein
LSLFKILAEKEKEKALERKKETTSRERSKAREGF